MMIRIACLLGGMISILGRAECLGQSRSPGIHIVDYAIAIDLPDSGASINGTATLKVQRQAADDTLTLDLRKLHIQQVTVDGRETKFARTDSTIVIPIPSETGTSFTVRVVYDGT